MKSGNFIELAFVVKGELQVEYINVEHVSRIMHVDGKPFIGMLGAGLHAPTHRNRHARTNGVY